jgi:hypothetical protein
MESGKLRSIVYENPQSVLGGLEGARDVLHRTGCLVIENAFYEFHHEKMIRATEWCISQAVDAVFGEGVYASVPLNSPIPYPLEEGEIPPPPQFPSDVMCTGVEGGFEIVRGPNTLPKALTVISEILPADTRECIRLLCYQGTPEHAPLRVTPSQKIHLGELAEKGRLASITSSPHRGRYHVFCLVEPGRRKLAFVPRGCNNAVAVRSALPDASYGTLVVVKYGVPYGEGWASSDVPDVEGVLYSTTDVIETIWGDHFRVDVGMAPDKRG